MSLTAMASLYAAPFRYKDMLTSPVPSVQTTTSSGTLRKEYVTEPGFYVYFVPQTKKAYVCEIR